ncbi:MAG: hypothetical protein ACXVHX_22735 [Solirubrobacteraceae bacterium]
MSLTPNRVVALLTALLGLGAAVAVPLAHLDWSSTASVIAGLGTVASVAVKYLDGWQKHEERNASHFSEVGS